MQPVSVIDQRGNPKQVAQMINESRCLMLICWIGLDYSNPITIIFKWQISLVTNNIGSLHCIQVEVDVNLCYCSTQNCNQVNYNIHIFSMTFGIYLHSINPFQYKLYVKLWINILFSKNTFLCTRYIFLIWFLFLE